ncbi:AraC family transcriptional regulator [Aureivirga sp. CE67]|uniref:AraC family transcriptional regulator n=1 Tax=Aureivirga sp. CE67 TaxID=1788983 RepID=UPI0018CA9511|nr:helix-turn-helix transcriptional regulator [Aureivirga sp. CE67]
MKQVYYYSDINDFLININVPTTKYSDFYIVKFEDKIPNPDYDTPHSHNYFEISFSYGYDAIVSVDDKSENVKDFNLTFVSPRQIADWQLNSIIEEKDKCSFMILFKPEFLPFATDVFNIYDNFPFYNRNTKASYKLSVEFRNEIEAQMRKIYEEYQEEKEDSVEFLKSFLNILLFTIKREIKNPEKIRYIQSRAEEITFKFENLVKNTKKKNRKIAFYAEQLNLSVVYLSECVKKVTGKTTKQIIDDYVILEAKSLLKQSNATIAEIAFELGFEESSNFTKYFKNLTGVNPKAFKEKKN